MEGLIALDLDGTVIHGSQPISATYARYLENKVKAGFKLLFISGRTATWMIKQLEGLKCHYDIAAQNGADLIKMPEKEVVYSESLNPELILKAQALIDHPFVVYTGFKEGDAVYWNPSSIEPGLRDYLTRRKNSFKENWIEEQAPQKITALKWIGPKEKIETIAKTVNEELNLHVSPIKDPFDPNYYVAQATSPLANKGEALKRYKKWMNIKGVTLAAGDDLNDLSMLEAADIKIAIHSAPEPLKKISDIVAEDLIDGVEQGLYLIKPITTVGVLIVSHQNRLLFARSHKWYHKWVIPGGKVDPGETLKQTAYREVKEETGLTIEDVRFAKTCESIYSPEFFKIRHFVMHDFVAKLAKGCEEKDVVLNEEAQEYGWFTYEEAIKLDLISPGKEILNWWNSARYHWF